MLTSNRATTPKRIADYNRAIQLQPDLAVAYYNKARAYSLQRDIKAASENLKQAIVLGAGFRNMAKTDADFDNIRQDKQFQALVGQ